MKLSNKPTTLLLSQQIRRYSMYSDSISLPDHTKEQANDTPLTYSFATPTRQVKSIYKLFNYGVQDYGTRLSRR